MTMVLATLKDLMEVKSEHAVYVKDANALLKIYRDSIAVIDLTNALQAGKVCKKYSFEFYEADNGFCGLYSFLDDLPFIEFVNNCRAGNYAVNSTRLNIVGIKYHESDLKACRVISPFTAVKKQNFATGKLNGIKLAKGILTGQIKEIICTGRYTDDYYDDAKRNFCKGRKVSDLLKFADELLKDKYCFSAALTDDHKNIEFDWGGTDFYNAVLA